MELFSNLAWVVIALSLLGVTYCAVRRGLIRVSMAQAMTLALLIGFILLPLISISDDVLAARQAALPLSGQTWRIATEDGSPALDELAIPLALLLFLMLFLIEDKVPVQGLWEIRPLAGRLARSQRLRPPLHAV